MCKTKGLLIRHLLQKNISLVIPEVQIQQKVYRQIKYEDTSYKIRIYEDCRSVSLKDLKKLYLQSTQKNQIYSLNKQNLNLTLSPLLGTQSPRQEKEERNVLRKIFKKDTARNAKKLGLESETISALIDNDFEQSDEEDLEDLDSIFPLNKYKPQVECRRKYKQNITSIIRQLTEKQPNPSELQQAKAKSIQRTIIVLALLANIISIV